MDTICAYAIFDHFSSCVKQAIKQNTLIGIPPAIHADELPDVAFPNTSFSRNIMEQTDPSTAQTSHRFCLMCGQENPFSFGLKFKKTDDGAVSTTFTGNRNLQGYTGVMHGGVLSALLDTAMAQCLLHQDIEAVTGELTVRYLEQVACDGTLDIRAWIDSSLPPLYHVRSHIRIGDRIVCKGKARFMQRDHRL